MKIKYCKGKKMTIGQQIKHLRVDRNIKQGAMARTLGITNVYLSTVELDKKKPSVSLLQRLAKEYNIEIKI